jgi:hypothetical protein
MSPERTIDRRASEAGSSDGPHRPWAHAWSAFVDQHAERRDGLSPSWLGTAYNQISCRTTAKQRTTRSTTPAESTLAGGHHVRPITHNACGIGREGDPVW